MNRVVPGAPVVKTLPPSVEGPVQSLIRELRSHMPHSQKTLKWVHNKNEIKKQKQTIKRPSWEDGDGEVTYELLSYFLIFSTSRKWIIAKI